MSLSRMGILVSVGQGFDFDHFSLVGGTEQPHLLSIAGLWP
jgi:hypothetical protein